MNPLYVIVIAREEIEKQDIGTVRRYIQQFENIKAPSQCVEINISGYDNTTDEVYEIVAIRDWITKLLTQLPSILYYSSVGMGTTIRLLASAYDIETVSPRRMTAHEAAAYFAKHGDFQQQPVIISIPEKERKNIYNHIRAYGIKRRDLQGANKIIKLLTSILN
jgi:hypothetical protein